MSAPENFKAFCKNLVVQDQQSISRRYQAITQRLNQDFWTRDSKTAHSLYIGSYGRNTAVEGASDFDMLFELPQRLYKRFKSHRGNGPSTLLQVVRRTIRKTYPATTVGADGQVVVVSFGNGMKFEVLPVFKDEDGRYLFPDANAGGTWRTTNPRPELKALKTRDALYGGNLRHLCRMIRAWKLTWNVRIKSLLIDTLAYRFIHTWKYRKGSFAVYPVMVRDFFKYLAAQDKNRQHWPALGSLQRVNRTGRFEGKAKQCFNLAGRAIAHQVKGEAYSERKMWRKIFGTTYP